MMRKFLTVAALSGAVLTGGAGWSQSPAPAPEPGKTETTTACTACHEATTYTTKQLTAAQWAEMVDHMIGKGAKVSDADYDKIVAYLARNYGAPATAKAP